MDARRTLVFSIVVMAAALLVLCIALAIDTNQQAYAQREFLAMLGNTTGR